MAKLKNILLRYDDERYNEIKDEKSLSKESWEDFIYHKVMGKQDG